MPIAKQVPARAAQRASWATPPYVFNQQKADFHYRVLKHSTSSGFQEMVTWTQASSACISDPMPSSDRQEAAVHKKGRKILKRRLRKRYPCRCPSCGFCYAAASAWVEDSRLHAWVEKMLIRIRQAAVLLQCESMDCGVHFLGEMDRCESVTSHSDTLAVHVAFAHPSTHGPRLTFLAAARQTIKKVCM
eukprot:2529701-Amphidinium_carterae.1